MNLFHDETLYALQQKIENIITIGDASVDGETGEVLDKEAIDALQAAFGDKVDAIIATVKSMRYNAKLHREEAKNQADMARQDESRAGWLETYLTNILAGKKWESRVGKVSYRKSTPVHIYDDSLLPKEYLRIKTEPDKTKISKVLKNGLSIPGAELTEKVNTVIK